MVRHDIIFLFYKLYMYIQSYYVEQTVINTVKNYQLSKSCSRKWIAGYSRDCRIVTIVCIVFYLRCVRTLLLYGTEATLLRCLSANMSFLKIHLWSDPFSNSVDGGLFFLPFRLWLCSVTFHFISRVV